MSAKNLILFGKEISLNFAANLRINEPEKGAKGKRTIYFVDHGKNPNLKK